MGRPTGDSETGITPPKSWGAFAVKRGGVLPTGERGSKSHLDHEGRVEYAKGLLEQEVDALAKEDLPERTLRYAAKDAWEKEKEGLGENEELEHCFQPWSEGMDWRMFIWQTELCALFIENEEPLQPTVREFLTGLLRARKMPNRPAGRQHEYEREYFVFCTVAGVAWETGCPATRGDAKKGKWDSAADAVAEAADLSYSRVKGIWMKHDGNWLLRHWEDRRDGG